MLLLASVFLVAACGLAYELLAASISSYLLGDTVTRFSLVIGTFLCAMGIGAWLSRLVTRELVRAFVAIEVAVGLVGGLSGLILFSASAFMGEAFEAVFYPLILVIGAGVGLEIPLLVRILQEEGDVSEAVASTLSLDYLGALAGSLLVPLVALPYLGMSRATVVFGLLNLAVAWAGLRLLERPQALRGALGVATVVLLVALGVSGQVVGYLEDLHYQDNIVYAQSTPYQRIVLTRWRGDVRLFLDGHLQFASTDEARYHEALVIPAMEVAGRPRDVLVLGGGDGLAVREILRYPDVGSVTLVDLDPEMTRLGRERRELVVLNEGALSDPRVRIHNTDAMSFVEHDPQSYDVILIDLPDPHSPVLARLYATPFYSLVSRRLRPHGVMVTQATSPYYATAAFWCIEATIAAAAEPPLRTFPYHLNVPSFGEWGFVMASRADIQPDRVAPSQPTRFLNGPTLTGMFAFSEDMQRPEGLIINGGDRLVLADYYRKGWGRFND